VDIYICTRREGPLVDIEHFCFCDREKIPSSPLSSFPFILSATHYLSLIHLINRESHSYIIIPGTFNPRPNQSSWAASAHQKQEVVFPPLGFPRRNHGSCDQRVNKAKKATRPSYPLATSLLRYSCYSLQRHLSYNFPAYIHRDYSTSHWTLSLWNTFEALIAASNRLSDISPLSIAAFHIQLHLSDFTSFPSNLPSSSPAVPQCFPSELIGNGLDLATASRSTRYVYFPSLSSY
jgi:hypothetical protein